VKYRVREPLLAVVKEPEMPATIMTIEPGSIIALNDEVQLFGFVKVVYAGQIVLVFMSDIENGADRVEGSAR
jgi:hypothetical protein